MMFKAILSNKNKPRYGQVTTPFPIPNSGYDRTNGVLTIAGGIVITFTKEDHRGMR